MNRLAEPMKAYRLGGDWKLWASMALTGKVAYLGEPLNYFRFHDQSVRGRDKLSDLASSGDVACRYIGCSRNYPCHILKEQKSENSIRCTGLKRSRRRGYRLDADGQFCKMQWLFDPAALRRLVRHYSKDS